MISLPPAIHRLSPIEESRIRNNKSYPQIAAIPESKVDKISLTNDQIQQFNKLTLQFKNGSLTMTQGVKASAVGKNTIREINNNIFIFYIYYTHIPYSKKSNAR